MAVREQTDLPGGLGDVVGLYRNGAYLHRLVELIRSNTHVALTRGMCGAVEGSGRTVTFKRSCSSASLRIYELPVFFFFPATIALKLCCGFSFRQVS